MFKNVLLPIDLNHDASWQKALPVAKQMAGPGGRIHLLGIVHDLGAAMVAAYLPEGFEKAAMERLKADLKAFADAQMPGSENVEVHVGHGHVPETILRTASHVKADAIVMASHPPHELQTLLIGSNADKVVRHSEVTVVVVR